MYKTNIIQKLPEQQKYDPWEVRQEITRINIDLHCSRYWMLSEWECENLSLPFWRIYHSRIGGSFIEFQNNIIELINGKLILIPPYTPFSSFIHTTNRHRESIKGVRITKEEEVTELSQHGLIDQFFTHFNLGFPFDKTSPAIWECTLNEHWKEELYSIEKERLEEPDTIDSDSAIKLNGLIFWALQSIRKPEWNTAIPDKRIVKVLNNISENLDAELLNSQLATVANMATNSFARLFKKEMQITVQQYVQQKRIEKAITLFHHTSYEIEEISAECGFFDRHHFSKIFKKITGMPPARYRLKARVL